MGEGLSGAQRNGELVPFTAMWGQVPARTEFIPAPPEFIQTNNNNGSSQGVIEMEKWQTGLWPVQFHIPLLRHNLNNPFS